MSSVFLFSVKYEAITTKNEARERVNISSACPKLDSLTSLPLYSLDFVIEQTIAKHAMAQMVKNLPAMQETWV